jgi:hypothetical protein
VGHCVSRGLLDLPGGWDTLGYHLPRVDSWIQASNLYAPNDSHWGGPGNLELLGHWFVAVFSGDFWIGLANLPVTVLLAIATYQLSRQLGLGDAGAHLTALAVVGNGVVWGQLITLDSDVAVAALFTASLFYGLRFARDGNGADLVGGAAASGLLVGVKYYALGYFAVACFAAVVFARAYGRPGIRRILLLHVLLGSTLGGYWYIRNAIATGTPFYPLQLPGGPVSGTAGGGWQSSFLGSGRPEVVSLGIKALFSVGGPCVLAAGLVFPLTTVAVVLSGRTGNAKEQAVAVRLALALVAVATFGVFLVTPYAIEARPGTLDQLRWEPRTPVRYGLSWSVLALCLVAVTLHDVVRRWPATAVWLSGLVVALLDAQYGFLILNPPGGLTGEVSKGLELAFPTTYLVAGGIILAACILHVTGCIPRAGKEGGRLLALLAWLAALPLLVVVTAWLSHKWHEKYLMHYDKLFKDRALEALRDRVPIGSRVCVMDARPYPFFGPSREFHVCRPTRLRTEEELIAFLDDREIPYLVVRSETNPFPERSDFRIARRAIVSFPAEWELLYHGRSYSLYRVRRVW